MMMSRIREMIQSLSLPIMIVGLFLTLCLDFFLYDNHRRMDGEVFTPYAIHRLEGIDNLVNWWDVVTRLMASKLEHNAPAYMTYPLEAQMVMAMNPMIRSIQILPEKGDPLIITAEDTRKVDMEGLLKGHLKEAADTARRENRLVLLDSVDVGLSHKMMVLVRPVFRHGVPEEGSFWGYIVFAVDQREVMSRANISNLGKQKLDYTLYHKNSWEEEPHLVKELGRTEEGNPHAERVIAGDMWTIILRP